MKYIDVRSDTVTLPKREMLEAILEAELGDDIQGEDPTVKKLEEKAAKILGMEAALLVTSGTMANQIAIMTYCNRGEEIILGEDSHIYTLEGAATAAVAQVQSRLMPVKHGEYDVDLMASLINKGDLQRPRTGLICLENTYNLNAGEIMPLENLKEIRKLADAHGLPIFLDGARIFNAAVEMDIDPAILCAEVDSVQFCLTKGLGSPVGSILAGPKEFIQEARLNKQRLGGGMRQAGIIAAPAIYALEHMIDRLKEDNTRAQWLGRKLAALDHVEVPTVVTNIVSPIITHPELDARQLIDFLLERGIKAKHIGEKQVRIIIHYQVTDDDLQKIADAFASFVPSHQY